MDSPSTNVAVMYTSDNTDVRHAKPESYKLPPANAQPSIAALMSDAPIKFEPTPSVPSPSTFRLFNPASMPPPPPNQLFNSAPTPDPVLVSDADLLLNLHSPFTAASSPTTARASLQNAAQYARSASLSSNQVQQQHPQNEFSPTFGTFSTPTDTSFGDMVIDTQDVDMSVLGADMMPWDLEYLPHDMLYFGDGAFGAGEFGADAAAGGHSAG